MSLLASSCAVQPEGDAHTPARTHGCSLPAMIRLLPGPYNAPTHPQQGEGGGADITKL
jgi:hypothetical protein